MVSAGGLMCCTVYGKVHAFSLAEAELGKSGSQCSVADKKATHKAKCSE